MSRATRHIGDFWEWWLSAGAADAERVLSSGKARRFSKEISQRIEVIGPELTWELAPGSTAKHALVITANGVAAGRGDVERWVLAAPPNGPTWEYYPSRQANPSAMDDRLRLGAGEFAISAFRFAVNVHEPLAVLDIQIFHPQFPNLSTAAKQHLQFLVLDQLLGEDDVVRWIGTIEISDKEPIESVNGGGLRQAVMSLAADIKPTTRMIKGKRDGYVFVTAVAYPLKWVDHPLLDTRIRLTFPIDDLTDLRLPSRSAIEDIAGLEQGLLSVLENRGYLTSRMMSNGAAVSHLYIAQTDAQAYEATKAAAAIWPGSTVTPLLDPGWQRALEF
ncbi:MAG: hypothetical protein QOG69_55 [Actinomycetota bacterium]|nr:hypothetical protein [Actinomycetota bacterium]